MIGISPDTFWQLAPKEVYMAIDGFREFNTSNEPKPLTGGELENLMELYPD